MNEKNNKRGFSRLSDLNLYAKRKELISMTGDNDKNKMGFAGLADLVSDISSINKPIAPAPEAEAEPSARMQPSQPQSPIAPQPSPPWIKTFKLWYKRYRDLILLSLFIASLLFTLIGMFAGNLSIVLFSFGIFLTLLIFTLNP
jgi:hypothetical protein